MKFPYAVAILTALLVLAGRSGAQSLSSAEADASPDAAAAEQLISPKQMLQRISTDQKRIWSFPVEAAARGKGWKPALAVIGVTAGLIALDPTDTPLFQRVSYQHNPAVHGIGHVLSGTNTGLVIAAVPISFYIAGLVGKDSYASNTALLAGEAVLDAELVTIAMKDIDRRMRPSEVGPNGDFSDAWLRTKNRSIGGFGSFPSGHTRFRWRPCLPNAIVTIAGRRGSFMDWPAW